MKELRSPSSPEAIKSAIEEAIARADAFRDARNWPQAREAYAAALGLDAKLQPIWVQLGHATKESGDLVEAEAAYRKAISLNPRDADAHLQLGHLLKLRGLPIAAVESYSHALALDPEMKDAREEIVAIEQRADVDRAASSGREAPSILSANTRRSVPNDTLAIVFDVSALVRYFQKARLPTGVQRVQIEVLKSTMRGRPENVEIHLACLIREAGFWIEIPSELFQAICALSVTSGDIAAVEWVTLLADLRAALQNRKYFQFPRGSVLLNLGTTRGLDNYFLNVRLAKSLSGVKYVPFVHDLIPAVAPEYCNDEVRQDFVSWAIGAFHHADYFLVNSKATLRDLSAVGDRLGHTLPEAAIVPLDADFREALDTNSPELLDSDYLLYSRDLQKHRYVLFVATVESRKNHVAAFSVWLKLLKKYGAKNIPKLVCVGSDGWLNDAAYARLQASQLLARHVVMLQKISDAELGVLYQNCLCTVFPSSYEGWGLPVTEALCFGKVPIVAEISSLPEAGGDFAEYFDPESEKDFLATVERIIFDEEYRTKRERKIALEFRPRSWSQIGNQVVQQLREWRNRPELRRDPELSTRVSGICALPAALNELHLLASTSSAMLWPGLQSGEMYRNGAGWWWAESWGTWIKNTGPAHVAFVLDDVKGSGVFVYVGLRGVQRKYSVCTLKTEGAATREIALNDHQDKVVKLTLPAVSTRKRLVVLSISCNATADFGQLTSGIDPRVAGVGVRWFYACREDDIVGRLNLLEALSLDDIEGLRRQPPPMFSDYSFPGAGLPNEKRESAPAAEAGRMEQGAAMAAEESDVVLRLAAEGSRFRVRGT